MLKNSTHILFTKYLFSIVLLISAITFTYGQTTITTVGTAYNGTNSLTGPAQVTFVVNNTNGFPILLKGVGNYCTTTENNSVWSLYVSSTSLSGPSTDVTVAPWTLVATSAPTAVTATGIVALNFTSLSYTIPAGTQLRFALRNTGPGSCRYSGTGAAITPNTFTAAGVTLAGGDFQIGAVNIGYSGTGTGLTLTPRYFTGSITFEPAGPCTNPPTPGTITSTQNPACLNVPFTLSLVGATGGTGQTYQWQISPNNTSWTNITGETNPTLTTSQTSSNFYRCIVTCGTSVNTLGFQVITPNAVSGTFTINNNLPTAGTNFNSYNAAYDYIKCGINGPVIFNVDGASGPYVEQLNMIAVPGASATNTVTFNGNGRTLQFNSTNTNERAVIKLNGAKHIRFDSINIVAPGTATTEFGFGVQLLNDADSNIVRNSTITLNKTSTSTNYCGISMSASATSATTTGNTLCDANVFENNTIIGGYYGITMVGSTTQSVARNRVIKNKFLDQYFYGVYLLGNFDALIEENEISRPTRTGNPTLSYGIFVTSLNTRVNISKNRIHSPFEAELTSANDYYGITHTSSDALATLENVVTNNVIYNFNGNGTLYGIHNSSSDNVWYYHNTIVFNQASSTSTEAARGFNQTLVAGGIEFRNNTVFISRGGTGLKHTIYMGTNTTTYVSNTNNLFITNAATNHIGFFNANQTSLSNWQTASGKDANSVSLDPLFANATAGNFMPTSASVNDLGAPLGITSDILNNPRSATTPDMGAWEFAPGACTAPPIAGTSTSSLTGPVCPNTPATFGLTGNSIGLGQTYQWQFSTTLSGPYSNVGVSSTNPTLNFTVTQTGFFRCVVTCAGNSANATPVQVLVNSLLAAGTYTIDRTAPASASNFISFNAAYNAMRCGIAGPIILNVVTGTGPYNEQLLMDSIQNMSAVNTVTWNGNGNVISFNPINTNERGIIRLNGVKHMIFNNIAVTATGTLTTEFGHGFHLQNNADSNRIENCTINLSTSTTSTNFAGVVISGGNTATITTLNNCDGNLVQNNTINGGYYGISLASAAATISNNNRFIGNKITDFYFYGIYNTTTNNTLIESNEISHAIRAATTTTYGIYTIGLVQNLVISKNRVFDLFKSNTASTSTGYGIYCTSDAIAGQEIQIRNNAVYNWKGQGIAYGIYVFSDFSNIHHNTVDFADQNATGTGSTFGLYYAGASNPTTIRNNNISITKSGTANKFAIYFVTVPTTYTSNNNNFYVQTTNGFVGFNGTNRATLNAWQTATSQDANSFSTNPLYISPSTGNLQPFSSLLDNKGANVNISTDIINAPRSATTPDIGAWEFAVPPCTAPPLVSTANANPNSGICLGTNINLTLTGVVFGSGQTYQWQTSTSLAGPYTNLGGVLQFPDTVVVATTTLYYRCAVTCSGQTTNSTPALVSLNAAFLAGTYTINPALPVSATNFTSFNTAVAALYCGITGHVIFNVATGTYTEQVRVGNVPGTGPTATVTFQSATGNPANVTLTNASTVAAANYTLQLDSSRYFTFKDMTINATNTTNGRVVDLANTANFNTVRSCIINAPTGTGTANTVAGVFSSTLRGLGNNTIIKNTINGGNFGIHLVSLNTTNTSINNVIDSNTVNTSFNQSIFLQFMDWVKVRANVIPIVAPRNTTTYGINITNCDSTIIVSKNNISINGIAGTFYGMSFGTNLSNNNIPSIISDNTITATTGNTGIGYGINQTSSVAIKFLNNVISINTTTASAVYGLFHSNGAVEYSNNSINNYATSTNANNVAAYLNQTSGTNGQTFVRNNIFAHNNLGRAIFMANSNFVYSDYNMLYTNGTTLGTFNTAAITTLKRWVDTTGWDYNSISYKPAFVSNTNLQPDVANPQVWGIHGRGVQISGNAADFNGNARPILLQDGVPDLGAYEFVPTSVPENLIATPAVPAANTNQKFSLGTDTVSVIKWGANVPASITGKRYTGTLPIGVPATQQRMYFYTDFDVPTGSYNYEMNQFYMDPWRGFIPNETIIKMGRTNAANTWIVSTTSSIDTLGNNIIEPNLTFIDKYTGLTDGQAPPPPPFEPIVLDSSNMGTRFWVGYGHHQFFTGTNLQNMVLYLGGSATPATVTVRINGTPWTRTYNIPANTVITSDIITKSGLFDARLINDGFSERGISITSNIPIVAYAHIYGSASSGATMLMPVGVYGYEYISTNFRQNYASDCYSWFYVIADRNNTKLEITPSNLTRDGRPANVPFTVVLNKGEVYQIIGAINSGSNGFDMTGSTAKSIPNSDGRCNAFAMFSGSSRTSIYCSGQNTSGNGDNIIQQNFPSQAWGRRYLTAPTSNSAAANSFHQNIYRVVIKDPTTVVRLNGTVLTGLVSNRYYEFDSQAANYITADKPIMVAQYMSSSSSNCTNVGGNGDPEMIYISPIEQGIKKVVLYRNTQQAIVQNYITLIIPTAGVTSLQIDGSNTFDHTYAHPNLTGYTVVVKRYGTAAPVQATVQSDSAFTLITYGLGSVESYGYNGGTLVKNLNAVTSISNTLATGVTTSPYTCAGTPFRFRVLLSVQPSQMTWQFSQVQGISPNANVIVNNPVSTGTQIINGNTYYAYTLPTDYFFASAGNYVVPINLVHPSFEGCNSSQDITVAVQVLPEPVADFTTVYSGCVGDLATFNGTALQNGTTTTTTWNWNFGDATTGTGQSTTKQYNTPGTYNVRLSVIGSDGCLGDTTKPVIVNPRPVVNVVNDSLSICINANATFTVQNPVAGATYNWYNAATGGALVGTGVSYTISNVTAAATQIWVEAIVNGCNSTTRKRVIVTTLPLLAPPVAVLDSAGVNMLRFRWAAVPNALTYSVSQDNGATWIVPSSGATGLTHTITGLAPLTTVTILVRANGGCLPSISQPVSGRTNTDQIYFPNSFTPNGDGLNDLWRVYGYIIKDIRVAIFNQWGEKIFETRNQSTGWDGKYKGKIQPAGVYMYVVDMVLNDGTKKLEKGSINLLH